MSSTGDLQYEMEAHFERTLLLCVLNRTYQAKKITKQYKLEIFLVISCFLLFCILFSLMLNRYLYRSNLKLNNIVAHEWRG